VKSSCPGLPFNYVILMHRLSLQHLAAGEFCTFAHIRMQEGPPYPHTHTFYELFWVEEGEAHHVINGKDRLLEKRNLMLIRASDKHFFKVAPGSEMLITNFAFPTDLWLHFRRRYYNDENVLFSATSLDEREFTLTADQMAELQRCARDLREGKRNRLVVERFLLDVLSVLANQSSPTRSGVPAWIAQLCGEIRRNPPMEGGTREIARMAGRSHEHLSREFRRHLGRTPTEILNGERMAQAAHMLSMTDKKIIDIALDCGLSNLGHFYKLFHQHFDQTPHEFRTGQRQAATPGRG